MTSDPEERVEAGLAYISQRLQECQRSLCRIEQDLVEDFEQSKFAYTDKLHGLLVADLPNNLMDEIYRSSDDRFKRRVGGFAKRYRFLVDLNVQLEEQLKKLEKLI